ncbi:hypothetical protein E1301_Tti012903 [Triplophysa tibetana]|uniref:Uncharacterized protein n=1 Tax=Triplophysa tibetana TaxID=1572043 RepID=A0A5A9P2A5_9TELE|nr:hypothetical protein E1301_Tti012903 [Triplophysa tibetana]
MEPRPGNSKPRLSANNSRALDLPGNRGSPLLIKQTEVEGEDEKGTKKELILMGDLASDDPQRNEDMVMQKNISSSSPSHPIIRFSTNSLGSHSQTSLVSAARSPQHRDPPQQPGLSDSMSLLPPGFRHRCSKIPRKGKKEGGTAKH